MISKERVHAALRRESPDRVPVFMWFHPATARHMAELLEIEPGQVSWAMGDDVRQTWVNNNYAMEGIRHTLDGESHVDDWGVEWVYQYHFNQISRHPLKAASRQEVLDYQFPYQRGDALLALMEPVAAVADEYFVGCDVSPCIYEMYWRLRGMEETLVEMLVEPETSREMFRRCADFSVWLSEQAIARYDLDWLWAGDDVAGQEHMMMSPAVWREQIKPELQRVFEVGKRHNLWVAFHCCGALRPIIPDLIEMGMDVLNPVQGACPGMDPLELKKEYGDAISFMGGVDTQELLPHGSVKQVQQATARLIEGMTQDGGGYILAAAHTIPPETPDDNIFAMYAQAGISREEIFDRAAQIRAGNAKK